MASRVGIIGLGMVRRPTRRASSNSRIASTSPTHSALRRNDGRASRRAFPQCERLETILEDRAVDAVLVLTPPNTHLDIVSRCAKAGSMCCSKAARSVDRQGGSAGSAMCGKLGVVLQHRFRPAAEKLRERLGELGPIVSASAAIPNWRPQSYYDQPGRGTRARRRRRAADAGIHTLDLFLSYTGEAAEVKSFVTTTPVHRMEPRISRSPRCDSRAARLASCTPPATAYPGFPERIELIGARGTALLEGTSLKMHFTDGTSFETRTESGAGGTGADPMAFPHDWHRGVLADFLDSIERNREPRVSGAEALKVHRFIDAILQPAFG